MTRPDTPERGCSTWCRPGFGKAYADWFTTRGDAFRKRVQVATLAPFHDYMNVVASFASCPIAEVARSGRTLEKCRREILAYFNAAGASNGGTKAINSLIEPHRRVARDFRNRDNCYFRKLLISGGLVSPHP